jgi:hypothetical protein
MKSARIAVSTVALLFAAAAFVSNSAPASAYPTGQYLTLNLDSTTVLVPGTTIHGTVTHVKPGCVVTVRILDSEKDGRYFTANSNGNVPSFALKTPSKYGIYTVKASTSSACVGAVESSSVTLTVGKATTLTAALATKSGLLTVKSKPVFVVSGTLKYGAVNVANASVTAEITLPNSRKSSKYSAKTNSQGVYRVEISGQGSAIGNYQANVTFAGSGAYLPSSVTSNSVTLTTPLR